MGISSSDLKKVSRKVSKKHGSVSGGATAVTFSYYFCFALLLLLALPLLLFKKKARAGFSEKLGIIPGRIKSKQRQLAGCLWFHAVSVGEFNAVFPLIKAFKKEHPAAGLVVSTTTGTGQALAREKCRDLAEVIYFPYDTYFAVQSWLVAINPALFVIVETEMWPGLISQCKSRGVPVVIVNGRISPRSYKSYRRIKPFFNRYVKLIDRIGAQTSNEAERYKSLSDGAVPVDIMGNLKCDGLKPKAQEEINQLRTNLQLDSDDLVFIAGSTHESEEAAVLGAYTQVLKLMPEKTIRLIIAPRHPQRFDRAAELIKGAGFTVLRHSKAERFKNDFDVYLIDSIGPSKVAIP
ncbi:MAG TPA: glycosyltransferase N-terminal domain-containing protein [Candidatus Obscuribacter sp.]|nr:glycosyltransferase N-terminal domain-containing protein [Candidatus Obscuribacter sp.]